jgi:GDPmannose 4,6-dehydratase
VHGLLRRSSIFNTERIDKIINHSNYYGHYGDLGDSSNLNRLVRTIKPNEIYNLAAQSHVKVSFEMPEYTSDIDGLGTLRIVDAIVECDTNIKFYQASTSELFGGNSKTVPQDETTLMEPQSPYATAKLFSYWITKNYRDSYNLFASNGILFNHESPRRGGTFVTRKITRHVAKHKHNNEEVLKLGNLEAIRDWGYAKDYVYAMWLMLQAKKPDDFVVATGKGTSVREFVENAFNLIGIDVLWEGKGLEEKGYDKRSGKLILEIDKKYFRPSEVDVLIGNYSKIKNELGWEPKTNIHDLVKMMVEHDIKEYNT